jgi:phosphoglycolate phosphatase/pyrophosphatase PpaX
MIRAVLMDLDGTLIDTWHVYVQAYQGTLRSVQTHPLTSEQMLALRPASELHFFDRVLGPGRGKAVQPEFLTHYARAHATHFGGFYPGVVEMLAALREAAYALAIVTGKSRGAWNVTVEQLPCLRLPVVVTEDEMLRPKPDPAGLTLALAELGVAPAEAVYLGDSLVDAQAARAAGMTPIAVLWPKSAEEREAFILGVAPWDAQLVETPADVVALLNELNGR